MIIGQYALQLPPMGVKDIVAMEMLNIISMSETILSMSETILSMSETIL